MSDFIREASSHPQRDIPLVVDLDYTLVQTDTLWESLFQIVRRNPLQLLGLLAPLVRGRARFKAAVARLAPLDVTRLPYDPDLLAYLTRQRTAGRSLVLATASSEPVAQAVASHLGLFDRVIASSDRINLKGAAKAAVLRQSVGPRFSYAGDSAADLAVWKIAASVVAVRIAERVRRKLPPDTKIDFEIERSAFRWLVWFQAVRWHQWAKNVLVFVPLFTSFSFGMPSRIWASVLAVVCFCAIASSTYLFNDLIDLDNDRDHPRKRLRMLASGRVSIAQAVTVSLLLFISGFAVATWIGASLVIPLLLYTALTLLYTLKLKSLLMVDVFALAALYSVRIVAGASTIHVSLSIWLLAFSLLSFLSLALVKRCSELVLMQEMGRTTTGGRGYRTDDLPALFAFGGAASIGAVIVFCIFAFVPETRSRYASPTGLWLAAVGMLYWFGRMWVITARGRMHDDPLVFALRDRTSRLALIVVFSTMLAAHFLDVPPWIAT